MYGNAALLRFSAEAATGYECPIYEGCLFKTADHLPSQSICFGGETVWKQDKVCLHNNRVLCLALPIRTPDERTHKSVKRDFLQNVPCRATCDFQLRVSIQTGW